MEKETKQPEKEAPNQPTDSPLPSAGTVKHSKPSSSNEGRRLEEPRNVKASGMGPISKTLTIQEVNNQDSWRSQVNKSTGKLVSVSPV